MATTGSPRSGVSTTPRHLAQSLIVGAGAGVVASLAMAMFAMLAGATFQHSGFFTPLHHIASTFIAPDAMMKSMRAAMAGHMFTFIPGPALIGAVVHMMVGAGYGAVFGLISGRTRLHGLALVGAAMAWGLAVFAASTWAVLPAAAALFGGGDPVRDMAAMVGHGPFVVEHLIYGAALGLLLLTKPETR